MLLSAVASVAELKWLLQRRVSSSLVGSADLAGKLGCDPNVKCDHHDHEHGGEGHTCDNHGCGSHKCH